MSDEGDKIVPLRARRTRRKRSTSVSARGTADPVAIEAAVRRGVAEAVESATTDDVDRIAMLRRDFQTVTKQLRLGTAAQMIAAARELIDGEPGYLEHCRYLDELQLELESDSV